MSRKKKLSKAEVEKKVLGILKMARRNLKFQVPRERDALIRAIRQGQVQIALSLLAHGVNPNSTDSRGKSALTYAGNSELVKNLVRRGAKLPEDVLMRPVCSGNVDLVRFLITHKANVNCTALTAFSRGWESKDVLLTEAIKQISSNESSERAALAFRATKSRKWKTAHPRLPGKGDLESIPIMLIKAGADVNRLAFERSYYEGFIRTTLGLAALNGRVRVVKAMIAAGANVNQKDTWGGTALFDAAMRGHRGVVRVLLKAGAKRNIKRGDLGTPASIARQQGFNKLAEEIENYDR